MNFRKDFFSGFDMDFSFSKEQLGFWHLKILLPETFTLLRSFSNRNPEGKNNKMFVFF